MRCDTNHLRQLSLTVDIPLSDSLTRQVVSLKHEDWKEGGNSKSARTQTQCVFSVINLRGGNSGRLWICNTTLRVETCASDLLEQSINVNVSKKKSQRKKLEKVRKQLALYLKHFYGD